eukprot:CAMPEP_0202917600 /NCGR_PEP_ID=MMETSP1392-20130828/71365_1 /ASSEMBLY_ACC=CAM_ASM_000868 /TAXON_ID=225041 /ORGANISM="Chlamydomonas chlamydogama, Strain SAG 11-48b" /LENGTH=60 /DNA_ID=CAMNT_0049610393 /DNA_START=65 /DNA_END=244 /DNA_ORIENTATION=+
MTPLMDLGCSLRQALGPEDSLTPPTPSTPVTLSSQQQQQQPQGLVSSDEGLRESSDESAS